MAARLYVSIGVLGGTLGRNAFERTIEHVRDWTIDEYARFFMMGDLNLR